MSDCELVAEYTVISFKLSEETITVDRSHSTSLPDVATSEEHGSHTLLAFRDAQTGSSVQEPLRLRIFFDVSVIEIYANDSFALSTRVYPSYADQHDANSIGIEAKGECERKTTEDVAVLSSCLLWQR